MWESTSEGWSDPLKVRADMILSWQSEMLLVGEGWQVFVRRKVERNKVAWLQPPSCAGAAVCQALPDYDALVDILTEISNFFIFTWNDFQDFDAYLRKQLIVKKR